MPEITLHFTLDNGLDTANRDAIDQVIADMEKTGLTLDFVTENVNGEEINLDDDVCSTDDCGDLLTDGEGYDGYCGNCADRLEAEGRWN